MEAVPDLQHALSPYTVERRPVEQHPMYAYGLALRSLDAAGVPYLVGGGLGLIPYGRCRDTKDLDIFIHRHDSERAMNVLTAAGFTTLETNYPWLRKAQMREVYIDLIVWSAGAIDLNAAEVARGVQTVIEGVSMRVFAPEDILLRKIYLMRDDQTDWADAFAILERAGASLDWRLLEREELDPLPLVAFLIVASVRAKDIVPSDVLGRHLLRACESWCRRAQAPAAIA